MRTSSTSRACCASATRASSRSRRRPAISKMTSRSSRARRGGAIARSFTMRSRPRANIPYPIKRSMAWLKRCREKGLPIFGQTATLRTGFAFTLEHWNLYDASPAWRAVTTGTTEEKIPRCAIPNCARRSSASMPRPTRSLEVIQKGVGGRHRHAHRAMGGREAGAREVRRQERRADCEGREQEAKST